MKSPRPRHSLDRLDMLPLALDSQEEAGEDGLAIHEHRAGAALSELAPVLGARQTEILAQDFEQGLVRRESDLDGLAVYAESDERGPLRANRFLTGPCHELETLIPLF